MRWNWWITPKNTFWASKGVDVTLNEVIRHSECKYLNDYIANENIDLIQNDNVKKPSVDTILNNVNPKVPTKEEIKAFTTNELIDDAKKIDTLQAIQRTMSVPYSTRAKIITPILNKLLDADVSDEDLIKNEI